MSRASELLKLPGVVSAGVFSRKGYVEEFEGTLGEAEVAEMMELCAALTMTMEMQGRLLQRMPGQSGWSVHGWMTWEPERAVVTMHDSTCVVQGRHTSFNQLIKAMTAAADAEMIKLV